MRSFASKSIAAIAVTTLSAGLVACAVSKPATIQLSSGAAQAIRSVEFPAIEADDKLRAKWSTALARSFEAQSVSIEKNAPFVADFALSVREARAGLAKPDQPDGDVEWQSAPRDGRLLDICKAKRLRGSLVIFDRGNGKIVYKGESEASDCAFEQADFDLMAAQLVTDAVR